MRKLLLTISMGVLGLGVSAQSSLTITSLDLFPTGLVNDGIIQSEGVIENTNGGGDIDVYVRRYTIDTVAGSQNYFCWGQCFEPGTDVSPNGIIIGDGQSSSEFYADYKPNGNAGTSTLAYCFYSGNHVSDSVCATIRFTANPLGVQDVFMGNQSGISESYPNPARSIANINFALKQGWKKAELTVYSMLGSKVKEIKLKDDQGTVKLPVSDLPSGMYFYTLTVDDRDISTKKMLVTK